MKRSLVRSSSIRSLGYDASSATLEIEYRNGTVYEYRQVPEPIYRLLRSAPSTGAFVNRVIKPSFDARRVSVRGALQDELVAAHRKVGKRR